MTPTEQPYQSLGSVWYIFYTTPGAFGMDGTYPKGIRKGFAMCGTLPINSLSQTLKRVLDQHPPPEEWSCVALTLSS